MLKIVGKMITLISFYKCLKYFLDQIRKKQMLPYLLKTHKILILVYYNNSKIKLKIRDKVMIKRSK